MPDDFIALLLTTGKDAPTSCKKLRPVLLSRVPTAKCFGLWS